MDRQISPLDAWEKGVELIRIMEARRAAFTICFDAQMKTTTKRGFRKLHGAMSYLDETQRTLVANSILKPGESPSFDPLYPETSKRRKRA